MAELTMTYKKQTSTEPARRNVYFDNTYVGYIIKQRSQTNLMGLDWQFISEHQSYQNINACTKKEIIDALCQV